MVVRPRLAYWLNLLLFVVALPSRVPAQNTKYEGLPVRNIAFNPVEQPLDASELHEILPVRMNSPLQMAEIRAAIDRLFATGHYSNMQVDIQPYRDGVAVTFITRNSWFIGDISVTGRLSTPPNIGQLQNASDLGLGQPYTDDKMEEGIGEMKRLLENNGLFVNEIVPVFDWETSKNVQQVNIRFVVQATRRARFTTPNLMGDLKADRNVLERKMGLRRWIIGTWKPMTQTRVRQSLDNLRSFYQKEDRLQAKVTLEGVHYDGEANRAAIQARIDAGPRIEIRPVGAKVSRGTLRRLVPVFQEHAVDNDLLVEGSRNLRDYFQSKGYFQAEVAFKTQNVINDKATIDFLINPGERHRLVHIEIAGNRYFRTPAIHERMFLQTATFLTFRHGRFSGNLLRRDQQAIRNLYLSNGFLDVQVATEVRDNYGGRKGDIAVYLTIVEGPQYFVRQLNVEGIESLDKAEILKALSSVPGQPYSEFNVAVDRNSILARYNESGFPDATFEWKPTPAPEPHQVDLTFTIREGRQQFVRAVLVSGNHVTRTTLINRQITLGPGDPLSPREMTDIQRRLYDLGVFAKVDTAIQNPDGATDRKYVLYNVDESRRYSAAVGFGAELGRIGGSQTNVSSPGGANGVSPRVSFDITRSNLWGLGHSLSLRTRVSTVERRGVLNYSWPRFAKNDNLSAQITGIYEFSRSIRTFTFRRYEGSAQLVHKMDKTWTAFYRFTYRQVKLSDVKVTPFLIPASLRESVRVGIPSFSLVQDRRDDSLDPHSGVYNTLDLGLAEKVFGSQVNFLRFLVRNATYHPITKRTVLARSTQFGNIYGFRFAADDNREIPLAERFYGGGGTSNRGFPVNQAGPRDLNTGFPLGGTTLFFNQTELRFPLIGTNIGGVLFHDMGNIYSKLSNFSLSSRQRSIQDFDYMVHAAGFGIRYRTPVGPLSFDIAYSINPPSFNGLNPNISVDELINLGPTPCVTAPGVPSPCQRQNLGHFRWFISIGQTF